MDAFTMPPGKPWWFSDWRYDSQEKESSLFHHPHRQHQIRRQNYSDVRNNDLLQNSDLPSPSRFFWRPPRSADLDGEKPKPETKANYAANQQQASELGDGIGEDLLRRALHLSQTRAREAERSAADASAFSEHIEAFFLRQSMILRSHQLWLKLLELEIFASLRAGKEGDGEEDDRRSEEGWWWTLAFCVGFVLGRHFLF